MRHALSRVAVLAMLAVGTSAAAQGGTATDQAVSLAYSSAHWDGTPAADLLGATASGDPLFETGWWYRAEGDTREFPFPAPDSETYTGGIVTAVWNNLDGKGFHVEERTAVFDNEGPSGGCVSLMLVRNDNATPKQFTLFHYVDTDLAGSAGGDSGVLVSSPHFLKFSEGAATARYKALGPAHFKVTSFSTLRNLLNDALVTTLDDAGLPFGPGDATAAFQFQTLAVPAGGSYGFGPVSLFVNLPADRVKGDLFGVASYPSLFGQLPDLSNQLFSGMRRTAQLAGGLFFFGVPAGTAIAGVDDFNADFYDETVSRSPTTGATYVGTSLITGAPTLPLNWKLSATGDFNADGKADIVWRNVTSQKLVIWTMNGSQKIGNVIPTPDQAVDSNWEIAGAADFNGDGFRDFLWYNQTSGKIVLWYMNGAVVRTGATFTTPAAVGNNNWRVVAVGDFGKGPAQTGTPLLNTQDIVWQNDTSLKIVVWHMDQSAQRTGGVFTTPDALPLPGYVVVGPR